MYFQVLKIVLWPRDDRKPRVVEFQKSAVNVITGSSKTGKSSVIPIIDYCLGSDKCSIPVGVIREACAWFGILVETLEGQKLLARREPGDQQSTSEMFMIEAEAVEVPDRIQGKNSNVQLVKAMLNRLGGVPNLGFDPSSEAAGKNRPSFRDLVAFMFQPQNVVANPDVLFFKADTSEHREKLKLVFPYVLGAVTAEILEARHELERLAKELRRKESDLKALQTRSEAWRREAQAWLLQAAELGVYPAGEDIPDEWPDLVDALRKLLATDLPAARPSVEGMERVLGRLTELRAQEVSLTGALRQHRTKLNELKALNESSADFAHSIRVQRDRLALSDWSRDRFRQTSPDTSLEVGTERKVAALCEAVSAIEVKLRSLPVVTETVSRETFRQREATERTLEQLGILRQEVQALNERSEAVRAETSRADQVQRFLGRLEEVLRVYDAADSSSELQGQVEELRIRVKHLEAKVRESEVRKRIELALAKIHASASAMLPLLDGEWSDAPIRLLIHDLTIKVIRGNREDYLWEIGSGANWLAYHVVVTLALQKFFLSTVNHPVPSLLVYDQPSQVYFPAGRWVGDNDPTGHKRSRDEDSEAVRKVFALLDGEVRAAKGRLQVIVLDHADSAIWGSISGVHLVEEWRDGQALVPRDWISTDLLS